MLKLNVGVGRCSYPQKQNVVTFHVVINTEIGFVYPCFFFYFIGISEEVFHVLKAAWF
jgi:hypothetical protein